MSKIKSIARVAKTCIQEPEKIKKGLNYIKGNGITGLKDKLQSDMHLAIPEEIFQKKSVPEDSFTSDVKFSVIMPVYNV